MQNRSYKDSLFKYIFSREENKEYLLELYNALAHSNCTDKDELEITTIENIIYISRKNDVSFMIGSEMYLLEQQSSYNPNMPLRGLIYFSQLYSKFVKKQNRDLYSSALIKLPTPYFYVFYNGNKEIEDEVKLKLSDSFDHKAEGFEWTATVLNINKGHNKKLLSCCKSLKAYADYVNMVKEEQKKGHSLEEAINIATKKAIKLKLLGDFFMVHEAEALLSLMTEFDEETFIQNRRREGYEEGVQQKALDTAQKMLNMNFPQEQIAEITDLSLECVMDLASKMTSMVPN